MDYLGFFALGGFVGGIVTYGLHSIKGYANFEKAIIIILAAALNGPVVLFIDKIHSGQALSTYCVGLLIALMWAYATVALKNLRNKNPSLRQLGRLHIIGVVLATLISAALVIPPAFRDTWTLEPQAQAPAKPTASNLASESTPHSQMTPTETQK